MKTLSSVAAVFAAAGILLGLGTAAQAGDAVTYQIDVAHSGAAKVDGFKSRLVQIWSKDLGDLVSYPVIAEGMVFVTVRGGKNGGYGTHLYALNSTTGDVVWSQPINGTYDWANAAYESGKLFVVNSDGIVRSFVAQTGEKAWQSQMHRQHAFSAPPMAVNGTLYVGGAGSGGTLYAVDETNGDVRWTKHVEGGASSSPAFGDDGIYVTYPCNYYKFAPDTGKQLWHVYTGCSGGGGTTPVYAFKQVYVRDYPNPVLSSDKGEDLGDFSAGPAPAFFSRKGANYGVALAGGTLTCFDAISRAPIWTFTGDGQLSSAPIVVNHRVIEGSLSGELYVLDSLTGKVRWSGNVGGSILPPNEHDGAPLTGLAAGGGLVVVPAGSKLVAYEPG